jgi:hypothetical protein
MLSVQSYGRERRSGASGERKERDVRGTRGGYVQEASVKKVDKLIEL